MFLAQSVGDGPDLVPTGDLSGILDEAVESMNGVLAQARVLRSYVYAHVAANSNDSLALACQSELAVPMKELSKLGSQFTAWVGRLPLDAVLKDSALARLHEFPLRRTKLQASKLLSPAEETLLAEVYDTSTAAWGRLHSNYSSQINVALPSGDEAMSTVRTLAYDKDSNVRREAFEAEIKAWKQHELTMAASLNSIKGQTSMIAQRRGWSQLLDESLFAAHIDRDTLEAMMSAANDAFPSLRRYLRAKAKALGHQGGLPWYDLFAPMGEDAPWEYGRAEDFVESKFRTYSEKMASLARRAFEESWVDAGPRPGKVDGAFCTGIRGGESRILMNYKPAFGSVSTLAHELGHAYHNLCLAERTEMQRHTPMTLAETASIFCETIIKRAAVAETTGSEKLAIIEASLQGNCQVIVDISSRFYFESEVVERRADRELSAGELCDAMTRAQLRTYGDGLDPSTLHPYMWAVKPHYYSQRAFYNFPYMFGLLFSLGLYSVYQNHPGGFHERYDALLSETGLDTADNLAARFGFDIRSKEFWAGSLRVVEDDVNEFVSMVG